MSDKKEHMIRNFFFKKRDKNVDRNFEKIEEVDNDLEKNVDENVDIENEQLEEEFEPFDVDEFIKSVESGEYFSEENYKGNGADIDNFELSDVDGLEMRAAAEIREKELIQLYQFAEQHVMEFSRSEWYSFVTKAARVVRDFCCYAMKIDPNLIELRYYCSNTLYEKAVVKNEDNFFVETNVQDGSLALAEVGYDFNGNVKYLLSINIKTPMRAFVSTFPDMFATLFHEMWHLKEFYEENQEKDHSAELQKSFVESVVDLVEEYQEKGLSNEEIKTELEKQGLKVDLEMIDDQGETSLADDQDEHEFDENERDEDSFRSRFERCVAYYNDIYTWGANGGECRADKFAYLMLRTLMKDADANPKLRRIFRRAGRYKMAHHAFSRVYVPVRAAYRALFNVNVPEAVNFDQTLIGNEFIAKYISPESIKRASELDKALMQSKAFELNEFHNQFGRTDDEGLGRIQDMFAKRNFRTIKKIVEADDQLDNMEEQLEDMQEDMEGETFTL